MVEKLDVTIIVDNMPGEGLKNSWGFSAYIVSDSFRILFDADTDLNVVKYNVEKLGIPLLNTDFAVLSHHHHDHYGGFKYIGEVVPGLKIYVPPGEIGYLSEWGLNPVVNTATNKLMEDVWIVGPLKSGVWGIYEEALAIRIDDEGLLLAVGCSHPGVDNLAYEIYEKTGYTIYWVVGGYHSPSSTTLDRLARISRYISPAHCSGEEAKRYVRAKYPEKYIDVYTGYRITLPFK